MRGLPLSHALEDIVKIVQDDIVRHDPGVDVHVVVLPCGICEHHITIVSDKSDHFSNRVHIYRLSRIRLYVIH